MNFDTMGTSRGEAERPGNTGEVSVEYEFTTEEVAEAESAEVLKNTEIHGDDFDGQKLTTEILKKEGLQPSFKISAEGKTYYFSDIYGGSNGRVVVVAYIKSNGHNIARSYYLSNSHGVWRYLPSYIPDGDGGINWYHKGHGEESVTIPIVFQKSLADIRSKKPVKRVEDKDFIFAGTARQKEHYPETTFVLEVKPQPKHLQGNFYGPWKSSPEKLDLNSEQSPDFSKVVTSWVEKSSLYGEITNEVFKSKDGDFLYMFCKDKNNRAWIGGIEAINSPIQTTGVREGWIDGGDIATPAYEYRSMVGDLQYANGDMSKGHYVDMFKNYLSKAPIIQKYLSRDSKAKAPIVKDVPMRMYFDQRTNQFTTYDIDADTKPIPRKPREVFKPTNEPTKMYFDQRKNAFIKPTIEESQKLRLNQAGTFEELFDILDGLKEGILGQLPIFLPIFIVKERIRNILNGSMNIEELPNIAGVRDKVLELLGKTIN